MNKTLTALFAATIYLVSPFAHAATYYFHNDHLGTPQALSDASQNIVWRGEYQPFGGVTEAVNSVEQNLRFPGQYYDQESGVHYNYFRDYDPSLGRYVQSDPIGLRGGLNTYAYVGGNPLSNLDRFGLDYIPPGRLGHGSVVVGLDSSGVSLPIGEWIADMPDKPDGSVNRVFGCGAESIPKDSDLDFIRVNGEWYKIKGLNAYVSANHYTGEVDVTGLGTYNINTPPYITSFIDDGTSEYKDYISGFFPRP